MFAGALKNCLLSSLGSSANRQLLPSTLWCFLLSKLFQFTVPLSSFYVLLSAPRVSPVQPLPCSGSPPGFYNLCLSSSGSLSLSFLLWFPCCSCLSFQPYVGSSGDQTITPRTPQLGKSLENLLVPATLPTLLGFPYSPANPFLKSLCAMLRWNWQPADSMTQWSLSPTLWIALVYQVNFWRNARQEKADETGKCFTGSPFSVIRT